MVKVREQLDGTLDLESWLDSMLKSVPISDVKRLRNVCELSRKAEQQAIAANNIWAPGKSSFLAGLEMADILAELGMDEETIVAAVIYRAVREGKLELETIADDISPPVAKLVAGVLKMAAISSIQIMAEQPVLGQTRAQIEQARNMLVSLVDDVRVAVIKLAERTCAIRAVAHDATEKKKRLAKEVFEIYTPLAHRLGIGRLKWELEDLSFRYLEPDAYQEIASLLHEKRAVRQAYLDQVRDLLQTKFDELDIEVELAGRVKHIYGIWRKMHEKKVPFSQVYDALAIRICLPRISDCYSVLGVVHTLWHNLPREFDDYIATPKENGYRSLHTAVFGPQGKVLEVQIRTHEMNREAEYGVCSHWLYKEGDEEASSEGYEEKSNRLRRILDWEEDLSNLPKPDLEDSRNDRIYVFTPNGHVVDMTPPATPIDFAYRVHTEIGHKCRGARVNGEVVDLTALLQTGDQVEILTGNTAQPPREWLLDHLGYLHTTRARVNVQNWYKQRDQKKNIEEGRKLLSREFDVLGLDEQILEDVLPITGHETIDYLYSAVASGEIERRKIINIAQQLISESRQQLNLSLPKEDPEASHGIAGVGAMQVKFSKCCKPVPGDRIVATVDDRNVVHIHRQDCLAVIRDEAGWRRLQVDWESKKEVTFPVEVEIIAYDRPGLLFDVTAILVHERLNLTSVNTMIDKKKNTVSLLLNVAVPSLDVLLQLLERINRIANVIEARRRR